jgi:drug/metabolite transporter (DMT)-like permease
MIEHVLPRCNAGTASGLAAVLLWSATMALTRSLSEQVGPLTAGASVHLIAGFLSLAWLACAPGSIGRLARLPRRYLLGCGSLFACYMLALFLGVGLAADRVQVLEVGLLNYLWPALTILLSVPILGKTASLLLVPGTLLASAGIILAFTQGTDLSWHTLASNLASNPAAYGLGLAAACSWALYSNLTRRWAGTERQGAVDLFLPATGLVLLVLALGFRESATWTDRAVLEATGLGSVTWTAYRCWDLAMRKGDVVLVSACSYLTPLLSTLLSCFYLGVSPGAGLWMGCLLVVVGSLLSWASMAFRFR